MALDPISANTVGKNIRTVVSPLQPVSAAEIAAPKLVENFDRPTSLGSVAQVAPTSLGVVKTITFTLNNTGMATVNYIIGDALGLVSEVGGLTVSNPTLTNGSSGQSSIIKSGFQTGRFVITAMNVKASVSASAFNANFRRVAALEDGTFISKPIVFAQYERNTAQDPKLLTLDGLDIMLSKNEAFVLPVAAGERLDLTVTIGAYQG